jgi:6-pyruvoyltetrahydropterin/6-carboxytetrahydropterin synthase
MQPVTASIARSYEIQAAHSLPNVPPGHKCGRLHGHTYVLEVELTGRIDPTLGWVLDFAMLDAVVKQLVVSVLDHHHLNEIDGLENPTSEVISWWVWKKLSIFGWPAGVALSRVVISENGHSRVTLRADVP